MTTGQDKAGKEYWEKNWGLLIPELLDPRSPGLANEVNRRFHHFFSDVIQCSQNSGKQLLEVGCARSIWLPYFAREHGLAVSGLDYSEEGCRQEEAILRMAGVDGHVVCADMFLAPNAMTASFDYVFTMGVVEHFADTKACVSALARFLRPGGTMITVVPNMRGTVGALQRLTDSAVHAMHVLLTPEDLRQATEGAGLSAIRCGYFLSTNYYVVNSMHRRGSLLYVPLRVLTGLMGRFSMAVWLLERHFGELPTARWCSPYIICVARKPR